MILAVCLDDKGGLLFNRRRQSRDKLLRRELLVLAGDRPLWMSSYSAKQFEPEALPKITVDDAFLEKAGAGDFCFAEQGKLSPYSDRIEQLFLFRWNKTYPADVYFDIPLEGWRPVSSRDFPGSSHDNITLEVYTR